MKVRIAASSRLHLGFMDLNGSLGRLYGSIGVALSKPRTEVAVKTSSHLSIQNVSEDRKRKVFNFVKAFSKYHGIDPNVTIRVNKSIPEHKGLGSGTQLALSISTALAHIYDIKTDSHDLSVITGRGMRSSIGICSFEHGGLIVDSGKIRLKDGSFDARPPKTVVRYDFPDDWKFVTVVPEEKQGLSGEQEKKAIGFVHPSKKISEEICRLVMMKFLPSLIEKDIEKFGSALTEIDRKTGQFFVPVQGGIYSEKLSHEIIHHLLESGAYGAGQSSWGPAIYGLALKSESDEVAKCMTEFLERNKIEGDVLISSGQNRGAEVEILPF
jgi:beta-ribofuranosylaminobenzene 5'-phosphate synthase